MLRRMAERDQNGIIAWTSCMQEGGSVHVIDFGREIQAHPEYLVADRVRLSAEGGQAAAQILARQLEGRGEKGEK